MRALHKSSFTNWRTLFVKWQGSDEEKKKIIQRILYLKQNTIFVDNGIYPVKLPRDSIGILPKKFKLRVYNGYCQFDNTPSPLICEW